MQQHIQQTNCLGKGEKAARFQCIKSSSFPCLGLQNALCNTMGRFTARGKKAMKLAEETVALVKELPTQISRGGRGKSRKPDISISGKLVRKQMKPLFFTRSYNFLKQSLSFGEGEQTHYFVCLVSQIPQSRWTLQVDSCSTFITR